MTGEGNRPGVDDAADSGVAKVQSEQPIPAPLVGLREQAQRHPVIVYSGLILTVAIATFGVAWQLSDQPHQVEVERLRSQMEDQRQVYERQLADVTRRLAGVELGLTSDDQILDVTSLTLSAGQAATLGSESEFHSEERFYALSADASSPWAYDVVSEIQMLSDATGRTRDQIASDFGVTSDELGSMEAALPTVHRWLSPELRDIDGGDALKTLRSSVFVQPFTHQQLRDIYRRPFGSANAPAEFATLDDLYLGDAAGIVLLSQLKAENDVVMAYPTVLKSVEKRGNLVYAEFETTLRDVTVNGVSLDEYFWTRRLIVLTTPDFLYLVKASDSSEDHRSPDAAWLNGWFAAFRVLAG